MTVCRNMQPRILYVLVSLISLTFAPAVVGANLRLEENGYKGVNIVIGDDVKEDPALITRIKEVFTDASELLFRATRKRAFFHEITIVVPSHWANSSDVHEAPLYINQFKEHIRVDPPNPALGTAPYVRGNMECGKPGWYMHLTPEFLHMTGTTPFGKHANAIVHEWGHLRWGLYDEFPTLHADRNSPLDGNTQATTSKTTINFYQHNGKWRPVTCSRLVDGNAYMGNCDSTRSCTAYLQALQPKPGCNFCPTSSQSFVSGASLMAQYWLGSMDSFCDRDHPSTPENLRHNSEAPNMQNNVCNGQSAWEVMRQHEDFNNNANPPCNDSLPSQHIVFNAVKRSSRKRVFVLDTSRSMRGSRITKLNKAAIFTIDNIIELNSWLGIVTFTHVASVVADMTYIDSQSKRDEMKEKVGTWQVGGTDIKAGLKAAVKMLEDAFQVINQTEIILISDGESNSPYTDYFATLVSKSIIVHTIAISDSADDNMEELANMTGGGSYTFLETESVSLVDVLSQAILAGQTDEGKQQTLFVDSYTIKRSIHGMFYIDKGLGKDTVMVVVLNRATDVQLSLDIIGPNNMTFHKADTTTMLKLVIPGTILAGRYEYNLNLSTSANVAADVSVTSKPISDVYDVIRVTSRLSRTTVDFNSDEELKLFVNVEKGGAPVLRATVKAVLAADSTVEAMNITLQDLGTGADTTANDGIYSAYLIKKYFTGKLPKKTGQKLRYNVKVFITGDESTYTLDIKRGSVPTPRALEEAFYMQTTVGNFQRQSFPREIVVMNLEPGDDSAEIHDTTPPAPITDLQVTDIRRNQDDGKESLTYTLSWTAVGDDMDVGQAANYSLRFDKELNNLRHRFNLSKPVSENLTSPKPAGELETLNITLTLQDCDGTCFLAIRTTDKNGLESLTSNVVNIDVDFSYKSNEEIQMLLNRASSNHYLLVVTLSIVGLVVLVVTVVVLVYCLRRMQSSNNKDTVTAEEHGLMVANP